MSGVLQARAVVPTCAAHATSAVVRASAVVPADTVVPAGAAVPSGRWGAAPYVLLLVALALVSLAARADLTAVSTIVLVRDEVPWTTTTLALPRGDVPLSALTPLARALEASAAAQALVDIGGRVRATAFEDGLVVVVEAPPEEQRRARDALAALLAATPVAAQRPIVDDGRRARAALHRAVFGDAAPLPVLLGGAGKPELAPALRALAGAAGRLVVVEGRVDALGTHEVAPAPRAATEPVLPVARVADAGLVVVVPKAPATAVLVGHAVRAQPALLGADGAGLALYVRHALSGFGDVETGVDVAGGAALWWARLPTAGKAPAIVFEDARAALARALVAPADWDGLARRAEATTLRERARVGAMGMEAARRRLAFGGALPDDAPLDGAALRALVDSALFPTALRGAVP